MNNSSLAPSAPKEQDKDECVRRGYCEWRGTVPRLTREREPCQGCPLSNTRLMKLCEQRAREILKGAAA